MRLSQFQLLGAISNLHGIADMERWTALKGRLQHFQRLGFPAGVNTGRGRRADYGPSQLVQLVLAFELAAIGLKPEVIVPMINRDPESVSLSAGLMALNILGSEKQEVYLWISPPGIFPQLDSEIDRLELGSLVDLEAWIRGATARTCVINLSRLAAGLNEALEANGVKSGNAFAESLMAFSQLKTGHADDPQA